MANPANDFIKDYQALAQQSWEAWTRQLQQQQPGGASPFFTPQAAPIGGNDTLERTLAGLKGYFDWMQGVAAAGGQEPAGDWRQQLQQCFGGASQPFAQAFGGIDSAGAEGFIRQWQSWLQGAQHGSFGELPGVNGAMPAFGLNREQQMQQQAMAAAVLESLQATARYQALIQRANAQGMERLQDKLALHAEPGRQIDSLKALYDLWVDAAEEAYAEIALSDEFREVYGEMVNSQMRVRQRQQEQAEQICRQLGVPTRAEVSSLGERLQSLRRELRAGQAPAPQDLAGELATLRQELAELRQRLAVGKEPAAAAAKRTAARPAAAKPAARAAASPAGKPAAKAVAKAARKPAARKAAAPSPSRGKPLSRASSRKRK
ncbi:MAG: pha synthase subunit protein [Xanthomonadaceae bacterium]|nr:pha synthase subunit protein [Xanthomonadaceae bacterium]MDE3073492.1 pha synthase subunit protein [Pseudomonadota bacterium]